MALDSHWRDRVTLKMLRYFHAVASQGHFSRAALQLNVSKSPLSAQIKELDRVLGLRQQVLRHLVVALDEE